MQSRGSTAECRSDMPGKRVRLPPALPDLPATRGCSSTAECRLGRPAMRVRLPPAPPRSIHQHVVDSFLALDTSGDVGSLSMSIRRVRFSSGPQRVCSGRPRDRSGDPGRSSPRLGCVIQRQEPPLAPEQCGFESRPVHLALVVEQSGTRLQPVPIPVQLRASAPLQHAPEPVHLGVESSSRDDRGEFDPLGSDQRHRPR